VKNRAYGRLAVALLAAALVAGAAGQASKWTDISAPVLKQLKDEGRKIDWPGETAGVAVDPATGDVFMVVPGQGLWKSTDQGKTFARTDEGAIGGRCETSYSLQFDPAGGRLACFMLDGKCAMTADGGKTWAAFTGLGRNWDYAAVDWSGDAVKNIFGARHETGGEVFLSHDAGKTWNKLFADPEFEKSGGLGIFDEKTLVYTMKGKGILRSTDAGKTWGQVSDLQPWGRVVRIFKGVAYWLSREGLLASRDKGATWARQGAAVEASIGPYFHPKDEKRMAVAGIKGIFETADGGETWKSVSPLPEKFTMPKAGWYATVAWDPVHGVYYASQMGKATYRLDPGK
jgi:photosystem II stability/assembly factor-like uncharacterized protein